VIEAVFGEVLDYLVETVFGHIKHNQGFRRFHLRGRDKVNTEWGLMSIAHNMQKLAA
jgi:hypothetical protein